MNTKITYEFCEVIRKILRGNKNRNEKSFRIFSYVPIFLFSYPVFTFAAWNVGDEPTNLTQFVNNFTSVLNVLVPFVAGFGFFAFVTGVLKYVNAGGDEERLGKAKQLIAYGLVGMFIMFSFWGLAKILAASYLAVGI
ncbi:MAG: hypothetical protein Q7S86_01295 [bacterium]|nr:hypothetical protein [bacterium]